MNLVRMFPWYTRPKMLIAVYFFVFRPVSSLDCSASGTLTCDCTATSIECSGIPTNTSEVQDILTLADILLMDTVILKIADLKFESNFTLESTSIRNLTFGYGFQSLPSNFFSGIPSLVSLNLQNNSIRDIDDHLFSSLPALKELFLDQNDLYNLTANMFVNLTNLNYLSIMRNDITEINSDVYQNLHVLKTLILSHNNITSIENLRITSTSITELRISNCLIEGALEKDTFSNMPNLELLDMSHNKFSEVKSYSLSILKNLLVLDLSYNSIKRLHGHAFSGMKNLTTLDLRGNQISVMMITAFVGLRRLKYLDLSANNLNAVLCEYTTDLDSLEKIYLQDNKIKFFTQGTFFYSPNLEVLNVSGNNLECSCSLTDTALHLIENTTMKKEDLEPVSCIIPPTLSSVSVMDYKSSKCAPMDPCKKPDSTFDYDDLDEESAPTSTHTESDTESTTVSIANVTTPSTTSTSAVTAEPVTESTTGPTVNDTTSPVTNTVTVTESTVLLFNATTTVITSTDISSTENTALSTMKATVPRMTTSSIPAGSSCSLLDLSVPSVASDSKFEVFKNFSYDGSTFCLKWSIAGNLENVRRCVLKYVYAEGKVSKLLRCPSVANSINIHSIGKKIYRFCLDIYVPEKTSFCNNVVYKTPTAIPTEMLTSVMTLNQKSTETVGLTETYTTAVSTDNYNATSTSEEATTPDLSTGESSSLFEPEDSTLTTKDSTVIESTSKETTIFKPHSVAESSLPPSSIVQLYKQIICVKDCK